MRSYQTFRRLVLLLFIIINLGPVTDAQKLVKRQRWEYCAIIGVETPILNNPSKTDGKVTSTATICYFRSDGCMREQVRFEASETDVVKDLDAKDLSQVWVSDAARNRAAQAALAKAAAQLGERGWELIAEASSMLSPNDPARAIYFKRRK